uniref:Uncharacterized protein n=1 Tax=Chromera velia CCMP2878 TaxID=1169474 RepID=A0A0G4HAG7_9ALVE|eukprot:Cvel_6085.t1-p1 / transcript=Cvel_6085.t1 / gene=Cvel_6085 / organism=Chromera_velia_CCMP2878 / gene_product=hypothetical protein / transcript_product=hypothetical protein / location=Cvel_scaffold293:25628-28852(+) / protein_length=280 / sequence_SO=supercontig / SO=protein_coding / is_pseudo=false
MLRLRRSCLFVFPSRFARLFLVLLLCLFNPDVVRGFSLSVSLFRRRKQQELPCSSKACVSAKRHTSRDPWGEGDGEDEFMKSFRKAKRKLLAGSEQREAKGKGKGKGTDKDKAEPEMEIPKFYRQQMSKSVEEYAGEEFGLLNARLDGLDPRAGVQKRVAESSRLPFDVLDISRIPKVTYMGRFRLHPLTCPGDTLTHEDGVDYKVVSVTNHYQFQEGDFRLVKKSIRVKSPQRLALEKKLKDMYHGNVNISGTGGGSGGESGGERESGADAGDTDEGPS